ncbi:MAG TPA: hypothetical protein VKZ96_02130 [Thermomicrobiales bacterium]|nr:hypothetical protein [Thermomicrobiales bacterium]
MQNHDDVPGPVDLPRLAALARGQRIAWSTTTEDLNVNLIVLRDGEAIEAHRNAEVDVLVVGIDGTGEVVIDGVARRITPDTAIVIPRGAERAMRVLSAPFAYLTCHRQRARLWPAPARRS